MTNKADSATVKALPPEPTPYVYHGRFLGERKGQPCIMLGYNKYTHTAYIEFTDGFRAYAPSYLVRRRKGAP